MLISHAAATLFARQHSPRQRSHGDDATARTAPAHAQAAARPPGRPGPPCTRRLPPPRRRGPPPPRPRASPASRARPPGPPPAPLAPPRRPRAARSCGIASAVTLHQLLNSALQSLRNAARSHSPRSRKRTTGRTHGALRQRRTTANRPTRSVQRRTRVKLHTGRAQRFRHLSQRTSQETDYACSTQADLHSTQDQTR
jgi:hypothetical protein